MKIGVVVQDLVVSGGYQKIVIKLTQELKRQNHDVTIYTPSVDLKICYPEIIKTLPVVSLQKKPFLQQENSFLKKVWIIIKGPLVYVQRFKQLAQKVPSDLDALIVNDPLSLYLVRYIAKPKRQKIVWMLNNQLPKNFGTLRSAYSGLRLKSSTKTLIVRVISTPSLLIEHFITAPLIKRIDRFATYDSFNKTAVEKTLKRKADLVYAGADLDKFIALSKGKSSDNKKIYNILSVGVLFPYRRYEDLILATSKLVKEGKSLQVDIVGSSQYSPEYYSKLVELIADLNLENTVHMHEHISLQKMQNLYKQADAFVFVNDANTWGIAVFEAIAAKLPVVITNNIGAVDLVNSSKYGWLVSPNSPDEVAKALNEIFQNPALVRKKVALAFRDITPMVSWSAYTKRMLKLLN